MNGRGVTARLSIEPDGDGARAVLRRSMREFVLGFGIAGTVSAFMALLFGMLAAAGVDSEFFAAALAMGAMAVVFLGGLQLGLRLWAQRQERVFEALLDRIELIAREDMVSEASGARGALLGGQSRLDPGPSLGQALDALSEPAAPSGEAVRRRTRT
jgi:hypothetical protein